MGLGERRMKFLLAVIFLLAGCGENDPFIAKTVKNSKDQVAQIEERIKGFGVVNLSAEPVNFHGPTSAYLIGGAVQVASVDVLPGESKYAGCGACHGANGGGGVGPKLAGKGVEYIVNRLLAYKAGETVGAQSNMMWGQAAGLSDTDINDLAEYIDTL